MIDSIHNFDYANPTRILFGKGQIAQLPNLIPKGACIFMTYGGGSIKRNGVYDQVMSALKDYQIVEFGGIEANPDFDTLVKAVDIIRKMDMDHLFLLAVGGGSVADGTKFIAAGARYTKSDDLWKMVLAGGSDLEDALPMGCVMTLPATGSESNWGSVISCRRLNCKYPVRNPLLFPRFAILDPETTMSLPTRQTINGVVDSIVHVCEQYLTVCAHADVQDRYAEALLKVLIENGKKVLAEPSDYTARANIMWASTQALNRWICQGVVDDWATHTIGHELTAFLGMDHARTLACIQPRVLKFQFEAKKGKLAQMGRRVFGLEGEEEEVARKAIDALVSFYENDMKMATHISAFVEDTDRSWIDRLVKKFTERGTVLGENKAIHPEDVRRIVEENSSTMYSVASSVRIASRKGISCRSFATAKKGKSIYRRLVTPTLLCAAGGALYYFYTRPFDKEQYLYSLDNPTAYELESLTPKQVAAHTLLMNRTFSRFIGRVMNITFPTSWRKPIYSRVSKWIGINTNEFEGTYEDYPTPNSFFTRDLKKSIRPIIRCEDLLLSPVDGTISILEENLPTSTSIQLHQVKGVRYDLTEFIGRQMHLENPSDSLYSAVIYLSPSNYHHIHTPCDFEISERVHVPGVLLPVKSYYANKVKGLFTMNERVVLNGKWREGFFSLGMVGAFNVGSIRITNPSDQITTNLPHELIHKNHKHRKIYDEKWVVEQGDRCGTFELGSTVVLAFEAPHFTWLVQPGDKVKMGQPIGYVDYTEEVEDITELIYPELLEAGMRELEGAVVEVNGEECEECEESNEIVVVGEDESIVDDSIEETEELMIDDANELDDLDVIVTPVLQAIILEAAVEQTEQEEEDVEITEESLEPVESMEPVKPIEPEETEEDEEEMW